MNASTISTAESKSDFLLLFRNTDLEQRLTPEEIRDAMERLDGWLNEWTQRGSIKGGQPLGPKARVISGKSQRTIADGPFTETKEVVGGYVMVSASSFDEAAEVAAQWPLLDYDASVEVRPVLEMCPTLLQWRRESAVASA